MAETEKRQRWWQTLPGMLTAGAALITALTGLLAVLLQNGVIGGRAGPAEPDSAAHVGVRPRGSGPAGAPSGGAPGGATAQDSLGGGVTRPWSEVDAAILGKDGSATTVRAETLSACISVSHELTLVSGQEVPFERMRAFRVVEADPTGAPNAKARVEIVLADGDTLRGQVAADCDLFGYNATGRYGITLQRLDRVDFRR